VRRLLRDADPGMVAYREAPEEFNEFTATAQALEAAGLSD
jgi:hypothetical protein